MNAIETLQTLARASELVSQMLRDHMGVRPPSARNKADALTLIRSVREGAESGSVMAWGLDPSVSTVALAACLRELGNAMLYAAQDNLREARRYAGSAYTQLV